MAEVKRIYPEAKTALINWIEENFHDIDSYIFTCRLKDGTSMTVHDVDSFIEALGMVESAKHVIFVSSENGEFKCRNE